jgi:hypothetical protein
MTFYVWLIICGLLPGAIVGIVRFRQLPQDMKFIAYFFFITLFLEILADIQMIYWKTNNLAYYHLVCIFQFIVLSLALRHNIGPVTHKKWIVFSIYFVLLAELLLVLTIQNLLILKNLVV